VIWEIYGRRTDPILFTYPTAVALAFWKLLASGELIKQLAVSLSALAAGFGVSLILGIILGLAMGRSRLAEACMEPHINALYATPQVALTPLLMMWLGLGFGVKVAGVFFFFFFFLLLKTPNGAEKLSGPLVENGRAPLSPPRPNLFHILFSPPRPFLLPFLWLVLRPP